jgi:hypothetical protein
MHSPPSLPQIGTPTGPAHLILFGLIILVKFGGVYKLMKLLFGLLYPPWTIDGDDCGAISGVNERQENQKCSTKTCASAGLAITDPT